MRGQTAERSGLHMTTHQAYGVALLAAGVRVRPNGELNKMSVMCVRFRARASQGMGARGSSRARRQGRNRVSLDPWCGLCARALHTFALSHGCCRRMLGSRWFEVSLSAAEFVNATAILGGSRSIDEPNNLSIWSESAARSHTSRARFALSTCALCSTRLPGCSAVSRCLSACRACHRRPR